MQYVHIKNLEKYHPGYKDRKLHWCKIFFSMVSGDPDFEMIDSEIDKWRFVSLIILELTAQKPIPMDEAWLIKKGWDNKKRKIALTFQVLQKFLEPVTDFSKTCYVEKSRVEESRVEETPKQKEQLQLRKKTAEEVFTYYTTAVKKHYQFTSPRQKMVERVLDNGYTLEQCKKAIDNFKSDDWAERHKYLDPSYCFEIKGKIDNFEKWLNVASKKENY